MPIIERFAVRAIIRKGNLFATQRGKNGEYKIPGGVEANETLVQALTREVIEETGLTVVTDTIKEIGEIEEIREDNFKKGTKFIAHSYYFTCHIYLKTKS